MGELLILKADPEVPHEYPIYTNPGGPVVHRLVQGHPQAASQKSMAGLVDLRKDVAPHQHKDGDAMHTLEISEPPTQAR